MSEKPLFSPPAEHRFKPGQSGNPNGRPLGSPNLATSLRTALNRTVPVRRGDDVMQVPAARAMLTGLVDRALQCDFQAIRQVIDLLKDSGHDQDVTDEEFAARKMTLSLPFTEDQYDLQTSEARKREYHAYAVLADYHFGFKVDNPPADTDTFFVLLKAADHERIDGHLSKALAACKKMLESLESSKAKATIDETTLADRFERVLIRIALLASDFVFARQPELALQAADFADVSNTPANWLPLVRAHARLLRGETQAARSYYFSLATFWREAQTSWERVVMLDFRALKASGFSHPLMVEVEKRYTDAGWSVDRFSAEVPAAVTAARFDGSPPASLPRSLNSPPEAVAPDPLKPEIATLDETQGLEIAASASDIVSGDRLLAAGRLEDALIVYKRRVDDSNRRLEAGQRMPGIVDERTKAYGRIRDVAIAWLASERLSEAESAAEYLIRTEGKNVTNQILYAHVCMFSERESEARAIYYETAPMRADENRDGRRVILDDFSAFSSGGLAHTLTAEIETMLSRRTVIK